MPAPSALHPEVAFARLDDPPPLGKIQFYDGYYTALSAGSHSLTVQHKITNAPADAPVQPEIYSMPYQTVWIDGPQFILPPGTIQSQFPPPGGSDVYDLDLPFVVLDDPTLPWERGLDPANDQPPGPDRLPWLALLLLSDAELVLPGGGPAVSTCSVDDFTNPASPAGLLRPNYGGNVRPGSSGQQLVTLRLSGSAFAAVAPSRADLELLCHTRAVNFTGEAQALIACVISNRLPIAVGGPVRFNAHLVSFEGLGDYLPGGKAVPAGTDVQLVSLAHWSFTSLPEPAVSFDELVQGLIREHTAGTALSLPAAGVAGAAGERLSQGYVPADYATASGQHSFAWYRGPFSPCVPQKLPPVGNPPVATSEATSSDALIIYLAQQGLFDLGYASAWQAGRAAALGDPAFAQAVWKMRLAARNAAARLAQRAALPGFAGQADPIAAAAGTSARSRAVSLLAGPMGAALTRAIAAEPAGCGSKAAPAPSFRDRSRLQSRARIEAAAAHPAFPELLAEAAQAPLDPVSAWLADLRLLKRVPLDQLIADSRLLPAESIRFFHVDPDWLDALQAGALSLGLQGSSDLTLHPLLVSAARDLAAGDGPATPRAGLLLRSQLVTGWPTMAIVGSSRTGPVNKLRDEPLTPGIRLALFDAVPDCVTLSQPFQGLRFGIEEVGVVLRYVTAAGRIGQQMLATLPDGTSQEEVLENFGRAGAPAGILDMAKLAAAMAVVVDSGTALGSGNFAIQLVKAPELQSFPYPAPPASRN